MLAESLTLSVLVLALVSGYTGPQHPQKPPQVVAVLKPEQIPVLQRQKPALDEFVSPTGNSPCADQIRILLTMARSCLGNVSTSTSPSANQFWCQDRLGCRETLRAPIRNVALACKPDDQLRSGAISILNQILYTAQLACPDTNQSCDAQAALVNDMMLMNSDIPEFRNLACSSCVKKSFGRMSLKNGTSHPEIFAKTQCNKINDRFCVQRHDPLLKHICDPCYQRSVAKGLSMGTLQGIQSDSDLLLKACYDDGNGTACIDRVVADLMKSNNITNIADATFNNYATLQPCRMANACSNPQCRAVLQSVVDRAGCCASALPAALVGGENLSCLRPMIEKKKPACTDPFTYMVSITLRSEEPIDMLCRMVREDLATTLATTSNLITCQKHTSALDSPDKNIKTIMARVKHYRSIGMPATIRFDPDLLQCPILDVSTSAVA